MKRSVARNGALHRLAAQGRARAEEASRRRVLARMAELELAGVHRIEAAARAMAEETKQPIEQAREWLLSRRQAVIDTKKRLEEAFAAQEAAK